MGLSDGEQEGVRVGIRVTPRPGGDSRFRGPPPHVRSYSPKGCPRPSTLGPPYLVRRRGPTDGYPKKGLEHYKYDSYLEGGSRERTQKSWSHRPVHGSHRATVTRSTSLWIVPGGLDPVRPVPWARYRFRSTLLLRDLQGSSLRSVGSRKYVRSVSVDPVLRGLSSMSTSTLTPSRESESGVRGVEFRYPL